MLSRCVWPCLFLIYSIAITIGCSGGLDSSRTTRTLTPTATPGFTLPIPPTEGSILAVDPEELRSDARPYVGQVVEVNVWVWTSEHYWDRDTTKSVGKYRFQSYYRAVVWPQIPGKGFVPEIGSFVVYFTPKDPEVIIQNHYYQIRAFVTGIEHEWDFATDQSRDIPQLVSYAYQEIIGDSR